MSNVKLFSQRHGHQPSRKSLQHDSVDYELRNRLWTVFDRCFWSPWRSKMGDMAGAPLKNILFAYWTDHLKRSSADFPGLEPVCLSHLQNYFNTCKWWGVYDFIEFVLARHATLPDFRPGEDGPPQSLAKFVRLANEVLEEENSAFRIHVEHVVPLTAELDLGELETALQAAERFPKATQHLIASTELLAKRNQTVGGYRDSAQEAIRAVRELCNAATQAEHDTLEAALDAYEQMYTLHPDLKEGLICFFAEGEAPQWGWTSNVDGEVDVSLTDARFVLVTCAATFNYLMGKMEDAKQK